ncbi:hypothetical protein NKR23_g3928 [Pleurostoma richardsiae]|uniref:Uncharacterized protein n=1 Tax=Pleurostoma richardsiae TaxID=41990 RepID=A0AA38RKP3_9PEZI|nr:hypothetical protein NKR23_g3928 [Pleurostoma richardsiae]
MSYRGGTYGRDREPDQSQRPSSPAKPAQAKQDNLPNRARQEYGATGPSNRSSSSGSAQINSASAAHEIAKIFSRFGDFVTHRAKLAYQRDALDKVMAKKNRDFNATKARHADFPSIPELHDKYKDTYTKERVELDKRMDENLKQYQELTGSLGTILLQALPQANIQGRLAKGAVKVPSVLDSELKVDSLKEIVSRQESQLQALLDQTANKSVAQETKMSALEKKLASYERRFESVAGKQDDRAPKISTLDAKLEAMTNQLSEALGKIENLQETSALDSSAIGAIGETVDVHNQTLANLDIDNLDAVIETITTKFPSLQSQCVSHVREIETLKKDMMSLDPLRTKLNGVEAAQNAIIQDIGSQLDALGSKVKELANRPPPLPPAFGGSIAKVETEVKAVREDNDKKYESLALAVSDLDTRYNNLTTISVAEHVIGQLERLYPSSRQLSADIDAINSKVQGLDSKVVKLEGSLGAEKRFQEALAQQVGSIANMADHRAPERSKRSPAFTLDIPLKKRKVADGANGHQTEGSLGSV